MIGKYLHQKEIPDNLVLLTIPMVTMAGRRPIFVGLVSGIYLFLRDGLYKLLLEPKPHHERKKKDKSD